MTSLDLSYDLIPGAYALVVQRLDAVQNRIHSLMVFSGSFLLTGPALAAVADQAVTFQSYWFYAAVALAVFNVVFGIIATSVGSLAIPRPPDLNSGWLELDVEKYKRASLWWSNRELDHNLKLVNRKGNGSIVMGGVLIAELALLVTWGVSQVARGAQAFTIP